MSHAVLGRMITAAARRPSDSPRGLAAASVLGALSPDVDFVLMPVGWDVYLRAHEIGTHSLPGLIATGLASAVLVKAACRTSRYAPLAAAAVAGSCSHVLADVLSGARLRPGWPFLDAVASVPLVAMADPWSIVILAAGFLAWWRSQGDRRAARRVLLLFAAFLAVKGSLLVVALRAFDPPGAAKQSEGRVVEARWGTLAQWHVFDRSPDAVRQWRIDARGGRPELVLSWPLEEESALVGATRALDTVRNFHRVHDLGFAVEKADVGGRRLVLWSDIRFCWKPESGPEPIACGLWFGGLFDTEGRVLTQQVRVGSWVQNRPPRPDGLRLLPP